MTEPVTSFSEQMAQEVTTLGLPDANGASPALASPEMTLESLTALADLQRKAFRALVASLTDG